MISDQLSPQAWLCRRSAMMKDHCNLCNYPEAPRYISVISVASISKRVGLILDTNSRIHDEWPDICRISPIWIKSQQQIALTSWMSLTRSHNITLVMHGSEHQICFSQREVNNLLCTFRSRKTTTNAHREELWTHPNPQILTHWPLPKWYECIRVPSASEV